MHRMKRDKTTVVDIWKDKSVDSLNDVATYVGTHVIPVCLVDNVICGFFPPHIGDIFQRAVTGRCSGQDK